MQTVFDLHSVGDNEVAAEAIVTSFRKNHPEKGVDHAKGSEKRTLLHLACMSGFTRVAEHLLRLGASVNIPDDKQRTALALACEYGHTETAQLLLRHGADPNAEDDYAGTPLICAISAQKPELGQLLLEHGAVWGGVGYYRVAPVTAVAELLNSSVSFSDIPVPLVAARAVSFLRLVQDDTFIDLLHRTEDNKATVEIILNFYQQTHPEKGLDTPMATGGPLLLQACCRGYTCVAGLLLDYGAFVDAPDEKGRTPLHLASQQGHTETAKLLLHHNANPNAEDSCGLTPLMYGIKCTKKPEIARLLLDGGADWDKVTHVGNTAIKVIAELLLNTSTNLAGGEATVLLSLAEDEEGGKMIDLLHFVEDNGAAVKMILDFYRRLHPEKGLDTALCPWGTLLWLACVLRFARVAELLLEHGASVNAANEDGQTPLGGACHRGHTEIVELLLRHGANPDPPEDKLDYTPLIYAILFSKNQAIQRMLLDAGADWKRKTRLGKNAEWAKRKLSEIEAREQIKQPRDLAATTATTATTTTTTATSAVVYL